MKKSLHALLISSLVFATSAIAQNISTSTLIVTTSTATTAAAASSTYSANSHYNNHNFYTSEQVERLVPEPESLTGKYNTVSRKQAVSDHEVCSAVLSGTIHKGKRMTVTKTSNEGFIMEKFFVKEWNQYLYASSFDLSSFECQ